MNAERDRVAERRAVELFRQSLLVEAVAGLVHDPEERRAEVVFVPAPRQAHVVGMEPRAERMGGAVDPARREVEADRLRDAPAERELRVRIEAPLGKRN